MRAIVFQVFRIVAGIVIPLASLATGLRAVSVDPFWLLERRSLLLRSLLAILVLVPLGTIAFLLAIPASPLVKTGLTVSILAIGIGPPAAFKRTRAVEANVAYEIELNVVLLILAIAFIPAAVALLGAYLHLPLRLNAARVAGLVLTRALIPLAVGVLVARLLPRVATPLARIAGPVVQIALLLLVAVAAVATWRGLLALGAQAWAICAAVALGTMVVGHLCGGPDPLQRRVLATFSSMRFPGLALLIASIAPLGKQVVPVVLAYAISSFVLVALYDAVTSRRARVAGRAAPLPPAPQAA
jgi:BASS family bile acid:Na+ symporter